MSLFGGGGSGRSGSTTTSTSSPDPTQQDLNRLYADVIRGVQGRTGGLETFLTGFEGGARPSPDFSLSPAESRYGSLFMNAAENAPGLNASYGALPTLQGTIDAGLKPISTNFGQEGLDVLGARGNANFGAEGLNVLRDRTNPNALLAAAERYMREIGEPSARAASVAGGMGGVKGGAFQEGLARASAGLALPIAQMVQGAQGDYGTALIGRDTFREGARGEYGQSLIGRDLAREQLGQSRLGIAQRGATALPGIATGLDQTRLNFLQAAQEQAGLPRLAGVQDYLRQQNLAASALLGIPVMGGSTTTTTQSGRQENNLTLLSLLSVLGPAVGAGIGAWGGGS